MRIEVEMLTLKVYLLKTLKREEVLNKVAYFIDSTLVKNEKYAIYHEANTVKKHCFNSLYPVEKSGVYKAGGIYSVQIRTICKELCDYLAKELKNTTTIELKGLEIKREKLNNGIIESLISVTPLLIKTENGYWKENLTIEEFLERIKINLIKKYNFLFKESLNEDFELFTSVEFFNKYPIKIKCKNINLLGDKVKLNIAKNEIAQKLAYLSLALGIGELPARGCSFVNSRWYRG